MKCAKIWVVAGCFAALFAVTASAEPAAADRKDTDKREHLHRASAMSGMAVRNDKNEDLGKVSDLMINTRDGSVAYAALSYGNRYIAVPLNALRVHTAQGGAATPVLILNAEKADLDKAKGFNDKDWPLMHDDHFGRGARAEAPGVKIDAPGVKVDVTTGGAPAARAAADKDALRRASVLIGTGVKDPKGESLGTIRDLMVDCNANKVVYAAIGHSGVLGVGEKMVAVAWDSVEVKSLTGKASDEAAIIHTDKASFEKAGTFDTNSWPTQGMKLGTRTTSSQPRTGTTANP